MDTLSALDPLAWRPEYLPLHPAYQAGNALGWLYRGDKQASTNYPLAGRLYVSKSGWLLLSVPNALVRGVYDALSAPGAELPTAGAMGIKEHKDELVNAHISVMTADEVAKIGADKINERGHNFHYTLGALKEIPVNKPGNLSKVWAIQISSPELANIRKSYGLTPLLNGDHAFHITVACRRKGVLLNNATSKGNTEATPEISRGKLKAASADVPQPRVRGGEADNVPDRNFSPNSLAEGARHEHEHTDNDQTAKEIAKDHLSEDPRYYEKVREIEKTARPKIIEELLAAKNHSDNRRYGHKSQILRKLMTQAPQDWVVDDAAPKFPGITHTPTKFQFHTDRTTIPSGVKTANTGSVYGDQLKHTLSMRQPIIYDYNKPVFENVKNHLFEAKRRGDFVLQAQRNQQQYRAALDPQYRYQLAMQAFRGQMQQPSVTDSLIEQHGDRLLDMLEGRPE